MDSPGVKILLELVRQNKEFSNPRFADPIMLGPGQAYHYTFWRNDILKDGRFRGTAFNAESLSCTQRGLRSPKATCDPGIVFAYGTLERSLREASGECDILKIQYRAAVSAMHAPEAAIWGENRAATVMIISTDILMPPIYVGKVHELYHQLIQNGL